jgi:release factor glutamine methyltransferase
MQRTVSDLVTNSPLVSSEARTLMNFILKKYLQLPPSSLITKENLILGSVEYDEWKNLEDRRLNGEPIAYLVCKRGFYNIELYIAPGVLIPRPETELLVEIGLREIKRIEQEVASTSVLDLGTGSGAIALAVAHAAPGAIVTAIDQSPEALAIAKTNAKRLDLECRVQFAQGSWYEALEDNILFDIILSNPPYIANQDPHLTQGDLRFEPISALTDHANGLTCLQTIIRRASCHLKPMGLIAVEHGFDQSEAVVSLMRDAGLRDIQTHQDLAGHNRAVSARK